MARSLKDQKIDQDTENDGLSDADLNSAIVTIPKKGKSPL